MGEKIKELRESRGLSITELAALVGVSRPAVSQWEKGKTFPNRENIRALAKALSVSVSAIDPLSGNTATHILQSSFSNAVPVLDWSELKHWPGGMTVMLAKNNHEYIQLSRPVDEGAIALRIQDESLAPQLLVGDEVVVVKNRLPQENKLVLVRIAGTGEEIIRYYRPRRGGAYDLLPEHPDFSTITVNDENPAEILGVVVRILKYID